MSSPASGRGRALAGAAPLVLVLSAWNNVVVPRLPGSYTVANVTATGALLAASRAGGLSWEEMGLDRSELPAGLRWGGCSAGLVASGYVLAVATPGLRPLLVDARVAGLSRGRLASQVLVRIPFGTVLWEEIAFRGVLLPALGRLTSARAAAAGCAVVFSVWHVRPAVEALTANGIAGSRVQRAVAVLSACLGAGVAGLVLTALRSRSGSLLAPALLHLSTNSLGTLAAVAAHRLGDARRAQPVVRHSS